MSRCRVRFAAVAAAGLVCGVLCSGRARQHQDLPGLDQRYEQIERGASTRRDQRHCCSRRPTKAARIWREQLLDAGASLEARDGRGANPLARAAQSGQIEIVALFLDRGAQIDARSLEG